MTEPTRRPTPDFADLTFDDTFVRQLSGASPPPEVGHQFGQWAGQLGEGRAIILGESVVREV